MATQIKNSSETTDSLLISLLRCPKCESTNLLEDKQQSLINCQSCQQSFPVFSFGKTNLPVLFSNIPVVIHDWCARINGFSAKIDEETRQLREGLKDKSITKLTRERMKRMLNAKKQYKEQMLDHLKSFSTHLANNVAMQSTEVAKNQGVDSYINNIFRDWCWDNGENEELFSAIEEVIDDNFSAGLSATLGAGSARLSYDFHNNYKAEHSILIDINPVLLGYAKRIFNNEQIKLNEFPIAPMSSLDFNIEQTFSCEEIVNVNDFTFVLADALNAPFESNLFDSVLTPWFIDIVPMDLKDLIPHVSRLLKIGGTWVNTGSLAFFHGNQQWNYSQEEVLDLLKKFGFDNIKVSRKKINYLHSPHSAHGRVETVFTFSAIKKFDSIPAKKINYLPEWLENTDLVIPQQANIMAMSSKYLLQAQVLSAVDGQRSVSEIGRLLAKQYAMPQEQAIKAVRQIFIDNL